MMDEDDEQVFEDLQRAALSHELDQIFASAGIQCESGNSSNVVDISDFEIISAGDWESHLPSSFASDVTDNVIVPSEPDNSLRVLEAKPKSKSAGADGVGHLEHSSLEPNVIADYNSSSVFQQAWNTIESRQTMQCWESGFWANIFSDEDPVDIMFPKSLKRPFTALEQEHGDSGPSFPPELQAPQMVVTCHFSKVVKHYAIQSWREERDAKWETAIRRWHALVLSWDPSVAIVAAVARGADFRSQSQVLVDIFYNKAPATLLKRCASISMLTNHLLESGLVFPCDETSLYTFFNQLRDCGSPASRMKGIFEALVFCRHILGVTELDACIDSRRCFGVTYKAVGVTVKQASPLSVAHLSYLHKRHSEDEDAWNRLFIGMLLFVLYSRGRWSDCQHGQSLIPDRDESGELIYIEVQTGVHKTARSLHLRYVLLPMVGPCKGIDGRNWGEQWLLDRRLLQCEDLGKLPLMPAPTDEGHPSCRPLTTQEAGSWMRMLLMEGGFCLDNMKCTSHSLKCTFLSYLAKRGVSLEDRRTLGYHQDGNRVPLTYSRDGAARPLAILESLVAEIASGAFKPDSTRSGRLREVQSSNTVNVIKIEDEDDGQSDKSFPEELSDGHITTSSSSEDDSREVVMPDQQWRDIESRDGTDMWQHIKLRTIHLSLAGYKNVLLCGRVVGERYQQCGARQRFDVPKCKSCFSCKLPEP